jgi:hypothetical protein
MRGLRRLILDEIETDRRDFGEKRGVEEQRVRRGGRSAAADYHVYRSFGRIDHVRGGCRGDRGERGVFFPAAGIQGRLRALRLLFSQESHQVRTRSSAILA